TFISLSCCEPHGPKALPLENGPAGFTEELGGAKLRRCFGRPLIDCRRNWADHGLASLAGVSSDERRGDGAIELLNSCPSMIPAGPLCRVSPSRRPHCTLQTSFCSNLATIAAIDGMRPWDTTI